MINNQVPCFSEVFQLKKKHLEYHLKIGKRGVELLIRYFVTSRTPVCGTPAALVTVHVSAHLLYGCLSHALTQTRYRNMTADCWSRSPLSVETC